ncbi:MAG: alkaline phosphatase D family protein [Acidobacteriota bacterium]
MPCYDRMLSRMSRRQLLNIAWRLGAAAVVTPIAARTTWAQPIFRAYPFALGVASGDPVPDGVVLWTRLAPEPLEGGGMPMARVPVGWEVARDAAFANIVRQGTEVARPELGHSVHVEVEGLEPGREYWYRFRAGAEVSPTGRTKTAPPAGAAVDRLRFAVCGCQHYEHGFFAPFQHLAEQQFDFVFHTGDYIYEDRADGGRVNRVRQHHGDEIFTLPDYRNRYAQYKLDPALRAAHLSAPFIMTWDDHEVDNDHAGDRDERDTPPEVFLLRRVAAYQAFYESMPMRRGQWPMGSSLRLYRRLQFGSLLDLSVLDTRQYRSDQVCGTTATGCAAAKDPARTMLGAEQERWLSENLASARARWTVLGQQVPTYARDNSKANPAGQFSMDKWDGYDAARQRLYARIKETKAPNPLVLSGDVHLHYGADLKLDFTNPASETIGAEFTNSSISSGGDGGDEALNWKATRGDNPHIKYHSGRRGYIDCTVTPTTLRGDFKIIEKVTVTGLPVTTGGTLMMEAGKPGCVRG